MRHHPWFALSIGLALVLTDGPRTSAIAAGPVPVTTCGQSVAKKGILTADLDCSAHDGAAIVLMKSAKLDLGGFTLTAKDIGVRCSGGRCLVTGPGTIRRPAFTPLDDPGTGIYALSHVRVRDTVLQNWNEAVFSLDSAHASGCTIENGGYGIVGGPVKVLDSTFANHSNGGVRAYAGTQDGIHYKFYSCKVRGSTFSNNGVDIESYRRPVVKESSCTTSDQLTIPDAPHGGGDEWDVCP